MLVAALFRMWTQRPSVAMAAATGATEDCGCDDEQGAVSVDINGTNVDGSLLRSLKLTAADGSQKSIADVVGPDGKALVVFLRHFG